MASILLAMRQATRRTQAERRAETERRLLEAAVELIAEAGVSAVTVAATGVRAGYSRGIVNHHFGSRRALLDALAREMQGRFSAPEAQGSGLARVLALVDAYLAGLGQRARDTQVFLVLWTEAIASDPDLRPVFAERDERSGRAWRRRSPPGCPTAPCAPMPTRTRPPSRSWRSCGASGCSSAVSSTPSRSCSASPMPPQTS